MIFYGTKASVLKTEHLPTEKCPNCQTVGSLDISILGKYAHVYWIPLFGYGKSCVSVCQHCKQQVADKELPYQIGLAADQIKAETKTPFYHFSLAILLGIAVAVGMYFSRQNDAENKLFVENPTTGDVYHVKNSFEDYTTFKVSNVSADSVYVFENQYSVNKSTAFDKIEKEGNYIETGAAFSRQELKAMLESGKIMDVKRK